MSAHTPGPWVAHPGDGWIRAVGGAEVARIRATCYTDQLEADMHLIAAAPALLEALEMLMELDASPYNGFDKARAAIAQAKGESKA